MRIWSVSIAEAIRACTWGLAHAINKARESGSIEVGKYADMIVLERNLFEIEAIEIAGTKVLQTVFAGKIVYEP
ncbi:MAG: amidohydrolase family protein [Halioglobus sp.]